MFVLNGSVDMLQKVDAIYAASSNNNTLRLASSQEYIYLKKKQTHAVVIAQVGKGRGAEGSTCATTTQRLTLFVW